MGAESNFEALNDRNHSVWKRFMKALLVRKGLWDVVSGDEELPAGSANTKAVRTFRKRQAEAVAEITLHVNVAQLAFITSDDPEDVWNELESVHQARGVATRLSTRRKFWKLEKHPDKSVQSFIAEARKLALDLADIGVTVNDEDIILVITGGLPSSYDQFVITLDSTPTENLTLDYVVTRLLNEEARQMSSAKPEPASREVAYVAVPERKSRRPIEQITCFSCGNKGHYSMMCPEKEKKKLQEKVTAASADAEDIW